MSAFYLLLSNPSTQVKNITTSNITEVENPQDTSNITEVENTQETSNVENIRSAERHKTKVWNADMDRDIIQLIKNEECLWNPASEGYGHKINRFEALERIAKEMKKLWPDRESLFTLSKCLSKFRNLRTYYQRERKKQENNKLRSLPHSVRWVHFDDMSFISSNSNPPWKIESVESNHSPVIIQFSNDNRYTSHDAIEENMNVSSMLEHGNSSSTEDQDGISSYLDVQSCTEFEEIPSKVKKKVSRPKVVASIPNGVSKVKKTNVLKSPSKHKKTSTKPKNSEKCVTQVIPVSSKLFSKPQTAEITHDEAFANFIAKDIAQIPEGKQKEQLRFKILQLIHQCKMDANLSFD